MSLFEFFWNLRQQQQIGDATTAAGRATSDASLQGASLADLNHRFDRLVLLTHAVAELAQIDEAALMAKIEELDRRTGHGAANIRTCRRCGRTSPGQRATCLYCGSELGPAKPFDGL